MANGKKYSRPIRPKKPPLTHFLCIPLINPSSSGQLDSSWKEFKRRVSGAEHTTEGLSQQSTTSSSIRGKPLLPTKAIRPIGTLHCTLGVMSLNARELSSAVELLHSLDLSSMLQQAALSSSSSESALPSNEQTSSPLKVDLIGMESMHDKTNTSILYIDPEDNTGRLFSFCLALRELFKDQGFIVDDRRDLKLHATIVNTIYAKGGRRPPPEMSVPTPQSADTTNSGNATALSAQNNRSHGHGPNANAPLKIDATQIIEDFKVFPWATGVTLGRISICEMGAKKIFDGDGNVIDEKYKEVANIPLPT